VELQPTEQQLTSDREQQIRTLDLLTLMPEQPAAIIAGHLAVLLSEVDRLRDDLAEERAHHDPRLRCLLVKPDRDKDIYVGWSRSGDAPVGIWSRAEAVAHGFPPSRLSRADKNGSSDLSCGEGHWDDEGFVAEQRGWLRREQLGDYAVEYLQGNTEAAYALLEPFDDERDDDGQHAP
jgi:hypothetical protein